MIPAIDQHIGDATSRISQKVIAAECNLIGRPTQ